MPKLFATGNSEISSREKRNMERARKVASQGMVLLENKGALPIDKSVKTIALFGNGARRTIKGGTGSGDVNSRFVVNVEQGLEDAGFSLTTKAWMDTYDTQVETARMGILRTSAGDGSKRNGCCDENLYGAICRAGNFRSESERN